MTHYSVTLNDLDLGCFIRTPVIIQIIPTKIRAPRTTCRQVLSLSRVCRCFLQLYFIVSLFKGYRKRPISLSSQKEESFESTVSTGSVIPPKVVQF